MVFSILLYYQEGIHRYGFNAVDLAVDTSGRSSARQECLSVLEKRGVLVCVGHGEELYLHVSSDLIATERAVLGSEYFAYREFEHNLDGCGAKMSPIL